MIHSASFFWRNDQPDGLGFTLNARAGWTPEALTAAFSGPAVAEYFRESDKQLGTDIVNEYLSQLRAIAKGRKGGMSTTADVVIAALNIMWLAERGFIPNNEFNGPMFVHML